MRAVKNILKCFVDLYYCLLYIIYFFSNLQTDESYLLVSQDPALMNQRTNVAFQTDEQHGYFTLDSREPGKYLHDR